MDKVFKVIKALLNALMTLILIIGITFVLLYVIGIEPFVVETGSMRPAISVGSLSFINTHYNYDSIKVQDVVAFKVSTGNQVVHRAINITEEGIETKGDANDNSDGISTNRKNYMGKLVFSIPKVGFAIKLIQTPKGKIILVTFIIVILLSGFLLDDNSKGKRYKEE